MASTVCHTFYQSLTCSPSALRHRITCAVVHCASWVVTVGICSCSYNNACSIPRGRVPSQIAPKELLPARAVGVVHDFDVVMLTTCRLSSLVTAGRRFGL